MRELSLQEAEDLILGATIFGTGGGGPFDQGVALVRAAAAEGNAFMLADLDDLAEDSISACPYICASVSPGVIDRDDLHYGQGEALPLLAYVRLEQYLGRRLAGVISAELGGLQTAYAMYIAAKLGRLVIDADIAGRAVPELQHSTFFIERVPISPMALVSDFGDAIIVVETADDTRAESLVRAAAVASGNRIGVADHVVDTRTLRRSSIAGTLSMSLAVGQACTAARREHADVIDAVIRAGSGHVLFRGQVQSLDWRDEGGFTIGSVVIEGGDGYEGSLYRIWFKNENLVAWFDDEPDVTAPDLICVLDASTGRPITTPHYDLGRRVAVVGFSADGVWRTERGLEVLGPRAFGYEIDYVPLERVVGRRHGIG